jgi:flagellar motor switch protein FliN
MTPGNVNQEVDPIATESGFEQAIAGAADFGEMGLAGMGEGLTDAPSFPASDGALPADFGENSELILGLPVMMKVVLGTAKMPVATLAKLAKGSIVKLDKMVGDPVDILVNGRLIARGEVVVLNEGTSRFGIVLTQVGSLVSATK